MDKFTIPKIIVHVCVPISVLVFVLTLVSRHANIVTVVGKTQTVVSPA